MLTPTFLPAVGGAELVLFEVFRRLAGRHEILLLTPYLADNVLRDQASEEYASAAPFAVERYHDRVSFMRIPGHRLTGGAIPPFSLSAVGAVRDVARRFRPDVLNVHYVMPTGMAGVVAEWWWGIPTVITLNGRDVPGPGVPVLWRWWHRLILGMVRDQTYVSGYCQQAVYHRVHAPGRVVYNGVDLPPPPGDGEAVRRELGVAKAEPLFFCLQRLGPEKQVKIVLQAMRHFLDSGRAGTLVVGGKGPEEARLKGVARDLGIQEHVRFVGYISKDLLGSYFHACDTFVFHSTFETFGLVMAQAMSYGRAVVTVRNTAIPEILGEAGLLVETGNWRDFGDAMVRLAGDDALRSRLGESGRLRAAALFNWDHIASQYEQVLCRAAAT